MQSRLAWILTAAWIAGCLFLFVAVRNNRQAIQWERAAEDALLRHTRLPRANPSIVIVAIDAASLQDERIGKPPWRPHVYAAILRRLQKLGAECVAFDLVLEHVYEPRDLEFARQIAQSEIPVVLASQWSTDHVEGSVQERWTLPAREFRLPNSNGDNPRQPYVGFINLPLDGELIRDACLFRRDPVFDDQVRPSFAAAIDVARRNVPSIEADTSQGTLTCVKSEIPLRMQPDGAGLCRIRYAGPRGTFRTVSVQELLGLVPHPELEHWIGGATVLVGATAPEYHDIHDTPMNRLATGSNARMPGVEIHANILNMLKHGRAPQCCSATVALAWTIVSSLLLAGLVFWSRPLASLGLLAVWPLLHWFAAVWVLDRWLILLPVAAPIVLGSAIWTGCVLIRWLAVHRERSRIRNVFSRCVHESVMEDLLNSGDVCPTAQHREVTVFFCDIRGFTQISEELGPTQVASVLRRYFEAMCEVIYAHRGAVDKFIGDAIMAFFGTPLHDPHHARHAVDCAVAMQRRLCELNGEFSREGLPALSIGFGISTGTVVAGMLGSSRKMEYTVVGDTVNVASRLEGMNKQLGTTLLITGNTRERLSDDVLKAMQIKDLGKMSVRGKAEPVHVYSIPTGSEACSHSGDSSDIQQHRVAPTPAQPDSIPVLQEA